MIIPLSIIYMMLLISLGYAFVILGYKETIGPILSRLIFYFLLPIIMFNAFATAKLNYEFYAIVVLVIIYIFLGLFIATAYTRYKKLNMPTTASVIISLVFQNTAFMPFPIALALYGYITPCAVYSFTLTIIHYLVVGVLAAIVDKKTNIVYGALRKLITMPAIPAGFIGIMFNVLGITAYIPQTMMSTLSLISIIGVYLSAIIVGVGLPHPKSISRKIEEYVYFIVCWRQIISPMVHAILALALIREDIWFKQVILESIMPSATGNTVIAFVYGFNVEVVAKSTVISTLISLIQVIILLLIGVL